MICAKVNSVTFMSTFLQEMKEMKRPQHELEEMSVMDVESQTSSTFGSDGELTRSGKKEARVKAFEWMKPTLLRVREMGPRGRSTRHGRQRRRREVLWGKWGITLGVLCLLGAIAAL